MTSSTAPLSPHAPPFGHPGAIRCERAVAELRAGRPVLVDDGQGRRIATIALDSSSPQGFAAFAEAIPSLNGPARLLLVTGLLGGFTTFSAFGLETVLMLRRGDTALAAAYVVASLVLGLIAVWIGMKAIALPR